MHISSTLVAATLPLMALASPSLIPRQASTKITVDPSKKYQTMDGFGFSAAFQRANLIVNLPEPKRTALLDILFSNTTGAGFTILRNGLGSTPNSNSDYMNTIEPTNPGSATATPKYVWDGKDSGQFWLSQQAVKYGVNTFYSNAWSAPGFMKTNNNDMNGGSLRDEWKQAYANYLIQYIQYYIDGGVPITHLGFLNEPDLSTSYASMLSNGQQAAAFIKVLRPSLDAANMSQVGIVCCESTGWGQAGNIYGGIKSSGADGQLAVVSSHEYTGRAGNSLSNTHPSWQTEYADLNGGWTTSWAGNGGAGDGMTWASNIYNAITRANVSAYLAWEGVQAPNPNTNEKLIKCDASNYEVSKRLWAFAQYSRTVRPGAVRLGTSGGNFQTTAFQNVDGSVAVNIINTGGSAATVSVGVTGLVPASAVSWLTDNSHDFTSTTLTVATDGSVSGSVPARAMVSFVLAAAAA
ncbi:(Trans)glycosidase [Venustampulla echinocandica]|uniref:(Trans)glycosidase n=1 Tax=Venustampulla echinocandica TaxID=2656787 RepID=A0A370TK61_9HELO|nr:(Trans)glycosidase [Venustampulla echinocandica]RDL35904.1 (Trans)glycosidase [Venustampulla echinocandica]